MTVWSTPVMIRKRQLTLRDIRRRRPRWQYDYGHRFIRVAAAVDWRINHKDKSQLWFVFRGLPYTLTIKVFRSVVGKRHSIARRALIKAEHDIKRRNRHGYYRMAVMMVAPDWQFSTIETMKVVISGIITRLHPSRVKWVAIKDFLNM